MPTLPQEQIKDFHKRGFIVLKGFFDTEVADRLSSWLEELSQKAPDEGSEAKYYEKSPISDEDLLVRAEYLLGKHNPEITDILLNERTMSSLEDLFGEAAVLLKTSGCAFSTSSNRITA